MQITFILPTVSMTGGNKVVAIYARKLIEKGHIVTLFSPPQRSTPLRAKVRSWLRGRGWPVDSIRLHSQLDDAGLDHTVLDRWRAVGDDDVPDADVVIATWWETAEWVGALKPSKGAKVYFVQGHEVFPDLPAERSGATYRLPLHKIVVSKWLQDVMQLKYFDTRVDLVPNSVNRMQFFSEVRDKRAVPTVGFLYSGATTKGLDVLMSALQSVRRKIPDLKLISFGSERPSVLPEATEFTYQPPQDQIRNIYARCDVWVSASRSEGFNLPAMEAMACRTPVVATRTGWPEQAVKSKWNGMLVDVDDVEGLACSIEWILACDNTAWKTLSSNAFATVAESSWESSAELFEKALFNAHVRASRDEIAGGPSSLRA